VAKLTSVPDVDKELDRLYGLPLEEFTAARDDLSRRVRAAGLREQADELKSLRKPPVSAWTVNQLARKSPDDVAAVATAGEQLAKAQAEALSSRGRERFAAARDEHASALSQIGRRIASLLQEAGRSASQSTTERALRTIRAASLDENARPELVAGRLQDDVEPGGFSLLAGLDLPARSGRETPKPSGREELIGLRQELKEARQEARDLRKAAATTARAAKRAREQAERAGEAAAEAEAAARQADEAVEELESRIARLNDRKR
jgi:DNA repair exonuclease SbcCD ATPase subunit